MKDAALPIMTHPSSHVLKKQGCAGRRGSLHRSIAVFQRFMVSLAVLLTFHGGCVAASVGPDWWVDIANDRVAAIRNQVGRGADVNAANPKGQPAIMQAIRDQAWKVYDYLASRPELKVNAVNASQDTPLMYLAVVGETQRAEALIRRGAEVNRLGWTPLHYAASTGKVDTAQMLIRNKAIINAPGPDGTTPLMMAAYSGSEAMVQLLLRAGADPTARNTQRQNAADWARLKQHTRLGSRLDDLVERSLQQRSARAPAGQGSINAPDQAGAAEVKREAVPDSASGEKDNDASVGGGYFDLDRDYDQSVP